MVQVRFQRVCVVNQECKQQLVRYLEVLNMKFPGQLVDDGLPITPHGRGRQLAVWLNKLSAPELLEPIPAHARSEMKGDKRVLKPGQLIVMPWMEEPSVAGFCFKNIQLMCMTSGADVRVSIVDLQA